MSKGRKKKTIKMDRRKAQAKLKARIKKKIQASKANKTK